MNSRRLSTSRRLAPIARIQNPYANEYVTNISGSKENLTQDTSQQELEPKALSRAYVGKYRRAFLNRLSSSQRPATRKEVRRSPARLSESRQEVRGSEELNAQRPPNPKSKPKLGQGQGQGQRQGEGRIRETVAKVLAKSPQVVSARHGLPSILSPHQKSQADESDSMQIVVTRGQVKAEWLCGDYKNNMNLQSYDFNQQQRLESKGQRKRNCSFRARKHEIRASRPEDCSHKPSQSCLPSPHPAARDNMHLHTPPHCPPVIGDKQKVEGPQDMNGKEEVVHTMAKQMGHCLNIGGDAGQALRRLLRACAAKNRLLRRASETSEAHEVEEPKQKPYHHVEAGRKLEVLLPSDYGWP
jgi:hypothetical protein